ncbi:RabGAP/TBC [Mycena floridula]|nr:RabGAP/TBC [Mycena floridula]
MERPSPADGFSSQSRSRAPSGRATTNSLSDSGYASLKLSESKRSESSETAIVSIYSMYGSDETPITRPNSRARSQRRPANQSDELRQSVLQANGNDRATKNRPIATNNRSKITADSYLQARPSSYAASSYREPSFETVEHRRAASVEHSRGRETPSPRSIPVISRSEESSHSRPRRSRSRSNSRHRQADSSDREYPPLPASLPPTPPRGPTPDLRDSHRRGSPSLTPPKPLKHPPFLAGSPSNTSLVPSEGEDLDGFHVRNTYAQLEMTGVKGDGFEEGIERTRARVGASRASQLNAAGAIGDGSEKSEELDSRALQMLANVDRYGFYATPSHERLVLLPSAPLSRRLSPSAMGPANSPASARPLNSVPPASYHPKEKSRIAKWTRMMLPERRDPGGNVESWAIKDSKLTKYRERTYKGVPDRWRNAAWELMMRRYSRTGSADLIQLGRDYRNGLERPSTYDIQIDLDVPRTISGHIMFKTRYGQGQRSLFHVLHSFSLRCDTCGYVQGMGPIAATLLCYFEPERVYASLVRLHDSYSLHSIFSPGFPGLLEAIYVQERITETMMPDVYKAFKRHMISTTSYATKWYITLFSTSVPFQTQLRMWDIFLLEGQDVFVAVAVAIVWVYRDHITSSSANFETVLSLLSSFFAPENEDALLTWIGETLANKTLRSYMVQWRSDWAGLVKAGKEGDALL